MRPGHPYNLAVFDRRGVLELVGELGLLRLLARLFDGLVLPGGELLGDLGDLGLRTRFDGARLLGVRIRGLPKLGEKTLIICFRDGTA